jgi:hypothetical protein
MSSSMRTHEVRQTPGSRSRPRGSDVTRELVGTTSNGSANDVAEIARALENKIIARSGSGRVEKAERFMAKSGLDGDRNLYPAE